jgi:hypothetical protein
MSIFPVVVEAVLLKAPLELGLEMMSINGPIEFDLSNIENNVKRKAKCMLELSITDFSFVDETGVEYKIKIISTQEMFIRNAARNKD